MTGSEQVFFDDAVAGLFVRGLGERLTPRLRGRLRELGIDLDKQLLPAYPATTFRAGVEAAGEELFPDGTLAERHYQVGCIALEGFQRGALGSSMFEHLKVISPERSVKRMEKNLRGAMNFIEVSYRAVSATEFELALDDVVGMPDFFRALIERGSAAAGRSGTQVSLKPGEGKGCVLVFKARPSS
jgi:uncharacterized protein (TIGR02265 family)